MLVFVILLVVSSTLVLLFNSFDSKKSYYEAAKHSSEFYSLSIASEFRRLFSNVEKSSSALDICFSNKDYTLNEVENILKIYLQNNSDVYGSAFGFNPYYSDTLNLSSPYYYKSKAGLIKTDLADINYNYIEWDWYKIPAVTKKTYWTEPYFDKGGGNAYMITYSSPIYSNNGRLMGVYTNDINLQWIDQIYKRVNKIEGSRLYITDSKGKLIYPYDEKGKNKNLVDYFAVNDNNSKWFKNLISDSQTKDIEQYTIKNSSDKGFLFVNSAELNDWKIIVFIPKESFLSRINVFRLNDLIYLITVVILLVIVYSIVKTLSKKISAIDKINERVASGAISEGMKSAQELLAEYKITDPNIKERHIKNDMLRLVLNLNSMLLNLENLVLQSQKAGTQVNFSADTLSSGALEVQKVLQHQSTNLANTDSTIDNMVVGMKNLNNNLILISDIANDVNLDAENGKQSLQEMELHLAKINDDSRKLSSVLEKMHSETEGISDVITEINNIAHRTNMLSINVEIEAEKTSAILLEKGLNDNIGGFRIVAQKINELALETANSSGNIEAKIANIDDTIRSIIVSVINYLELITHTSSTINAVSLNLNNIITKAQDLVEHFVVFKDSMLVQSKEIYNISSLIKSITDCSENIQKSMLDFEHQIEKTNSSVKNMQNSLASFSTDKCLL
jgi:sigma-B regulation protein RsbU (phosphoserine phosphatase)